MHLHIVTLNIPYPPDYGGMIDTFYRIQALHNLGVRIHLHCFEYGREHSKELEALCEKTYYYPRKTGLLRQFSMIPFIVSGRKSKLLLANLLKDNYPILFDGLHSTSHIKHPALSERKKVVRLHNIEHNYYNNLANNETNLLKHAYFFLESLKLRHYEKVLKKADYILPISENDHEYFKKKYHNSIILAPFHPFSEPENLPGKGDYIIYHGDLSVNENAIVADSLISDVFSKVTCKCVIAGKDPSESLISHAASFPNIIIVSNPESEKMRELIANAHICLAPALSSNGFKLKLLFALYAGRFCIVNSVMGNNESIMKLCHIADTSEEMINKIHLLMNNPFTEEISSERRKVLSENYDVKKNGEKLVELIFG
jgi:glycosyltransferase involved in cell wall biosynthesis